MLQWKPCALDLPFAAPPWHLGFHQEPHFPVCAGLAACPELKVLLVPRRLLKAAQVLGVGGLKPLIRGLGDPLSSQDPGSVQGCLAMQFPASTQLRALQAKCCLVLLTS